MNLNILEGILLIPIVIFALSCFFCFGFEIIYLLLNFRSIYRKWKILGFWKGYYYR